MGSDKKFQYTVMGDAVNQAARFEPANKPFDTHIMIGGKTYEMAKDKIEARFLANMIVKGKTEPVPCYELLAKKGELSETKARVVQLFEEGWKLHAAKKFPQAIAKFDEALAVDANDGPSKAYKKICEGFLKSPPLDTWAGEYIQTSK
jgi:adenylate cyclase